MAKWMLQRKGADYNLISERLGIDPLVARIMVNRGVDTIEKMEAYLHGGRECFHSPTLMKDMEKAACIIRSKIDEGKSIRIIGDYDGDGVCSVTILLKGLKSLGAKVDGVIPHRIRDGYGINLRMVEEAKEAGIDTIITCDNGISAYNEIEKAKEYGMTVIVTDHHEVPHNEDGEYIIPPAEAVVDPKQNDCQYPFKHICGAFVAYKLMTMLIDATDTELTNELMMFAAFATVTDIMELKDENRCLVKEGLRIMKDTKSIGMQALLEVLELYGQEVSAFNLGFMLGPCVNAAGRIGSADRALELFMSDSHKDAMSLAGDLKSMNEGRKNLTEQALAKAIDSIENTDIGKDRVLVVYIRDCHESVAGIVAGRIKERYYKPTMVITDSEGILKGSARSIPTYNMYEEMTKVSDVFLKYGGHPQAAGFSLEKDRLEELRTRLNEICTLSEDDLISRISIDADAPFSYCTGKLVDELSLLEPLGNGNENPVFARKNLKLLRAKMIGNTGKVGKYTVEDTDGYKCELTFFMRNEELKNYLILRYGEDAISRLYSQGCAGITISVTYYPSWNEYMGRRNLQYIMTDYC